MKNFIQLEINNNIRCKCKFLHMIEEIVLNTFKSYRINNIKYNADNGLCSKYLYIDLKTHNNKTVLLSFVERNTDGIFIWPPHINYEDLQTHSTIILYNYLKYRGLIKEKAEFDKYRIFGNINSSKEEINEKLHNYFEVLLSVLKIDEVDKLIHTDYWIEVPVDYKEWG